MSYRTWPDDKLISHYNNLKMERAIGPRSWKAYLIGAYIILGCLGAAGVMLTTLERTSAVELTIFLSCLPAVPLAFYFLRRESERERGFQELELEMQRRGFTSPF